MARDDLYVWAQEDIDINGSLFAHNGMHVIANTGDITFAAPFPGPDPRGNLNANEAVLRAEAGSVYINTELQNNWGSLRVEASDSTIVLTADVTAQTDLVLDDATVLNTADVDLTSTAGGVYLNDAVTGTSGTSLTVSAVNGDVVLHQIGTAGGNPPGTDIDGTPAAMGAITVISGGTATLLGEYLHGQRSGGLPRRQ